MMMYGVKYYSEFDDLDNNRIKLEICYNGYNGAATELTIADPSISISYDQEDLFQPLKKSGASINLLVPNVIEDLFSGELLNPLVRIYRNNSLYWWGYITPNIYSQPYKDELDLLTLECVDSISNLANIDFKTNSEISSFLDIITNVLTSANTICNYIYIPISVKIGSNNDVLSNLYIQERNFYDEANEAEKCDEVIGEILRYLGYTMMQWKDSYYIIDSTAIASNDYSFIRYNINNGNKSNVTLSLAPRNVNDIGIGVGNGTVSLDGVYNKVTVIAQNNPLGNILPEFDNDKDIINQNANQDNYYSESYTDNDINYTLLSAFFDSQSNWTHTTPKVNYTEVGEVTLSNRDTLNEGVYWQKIDQYQTNDGEPPSLSWKTYITMVGGGLVGTLPHIELNNAKPMIIDGGYIIINLKYIFKTDARPHTSVKSMYNSSTYGTCTQLTWTDSVADIGNGQWPNNTTFQAELTVGDYLYNGEQWERKDDYQARQQRYNSLYSGWGIDYAGQHQWYRFRNSYGDWEYIPQEAWESSTAAVKESGECPTNNAHFLYHTNYGTTKVYIPNEFYYEYYFGGFFFLVHVNKTSERIYDTEYSLTNTVSYKMNIVDSGEGVAIKCPSDISIFGNFGFKLWACDKLGNNPQPRNDKPSSTLKAIHISDLTIKYSKSNSYNSIFSTSTADPDTKYSNVIDSGFCQSLEDITLKVNTHNDIATSYSYVIAKNGNNYYYIDALRYGSTDKVPERRLVERYVNYHSTPKYKYGNTLKNNDVTPFTQVTETNLGKTMIVTKANYDLSNNNVEIQANQLL